MLMRLEGAWPEAHMGHVSTLIFARAMLFTTTIFGALCSPEVAPRARQVRPTPLCRPHKIRPIEIMMARPYVQQNGLLFNTRHSPRPKHR
jgi:hypothetical protein